MKPPEGPTAERLFSLFLDLVHIDSESRKEGRVCSYVKDFCADLGLAVYEDGAGSETGGDSGNLVVKVPGAGPAQATPIILNAHMDTVVPGTGISAVDAGGRFSSETETILGADCKAGIAAILASAEWVLGSRNEHRPLELIFTVQEESGLVGAKHLDLARIEGHHGVVLDGSGPVGGIVVEAPGQITAKFAVHGRSAHAGVEPEKGINAITCAARAVAGLRVGRHDEQTTSNVGVISGGHAVNIVPDTAVVQAEVRSLSNARLQEECEAMVAGFNRAAKSCGCELEVELERSFEHFKLEADSQSVMLLSEAMKRCGLQPRLVTSGGGSDANVLNSAGLELVVMNIGIANAHSKSEYILKEDLLSVARTVSELSACWDGREWETQP
jgi:tripeptide aminopeptidase